ncbi:MAG: hypothetical protein KUG78_20780 [Kangiellaceae bacterium]|nr:hypothetical protein [Kangiellaceae bacterium]
MVFIFPTFVYATSNQPFHALTLLFWLLATNIIPLVVFVGSIVFLLWLAKINSQTGYYIKIRDIKIWQSNLDLDRAGFDRIAHLFGIKNYLIKQANTSVELVSHKPAKQDATYVIVDIDCLSQSSSKK